MFGVMLGTDAFDLCAIAGAGGADEALLADLKVSLQETLFIAVDGDRVTEIGSEDVAGYMCLNQRPLSPVMM